MWKAVETLIKNSGNYIFYEVYQVLRVLEGPSGLLSWLISRYHILCPMTINHESNVESQKALPQEDCILCLTYPILLMKF